MPYAYNRRIRIHYEVEGDGPPLVLLHGGLNDLRVWYDLGYIESLKNDYRLILIDLRGYGASDKPHDSRAYEMKLLVDDIVAVLDDLKVGKAHLLGYSLSGRICFGAAKYAPERFHSFIIGGAHAGMLDQNEHKDDVELLKKGADALIAAIEKDLGSQLPPERRARLAAIDFEAVVALFSASHWRLSFEDVLPAMTMLCLIFVGEADSLHSGAKECAKNLPNATFISFPNLGHFQLLSQRHLLLPHITKFLTKASQT
jgi:pimeloyl-ACP methyl ester carboxylesterase